MTLRADGPEYVPLRTFRDDDLLDPGSDPLIALMGALSALNEGERVVARLLLRSLGPDWSQPHLEKAHKRPGMEPREPAYTFQTKPLQMDGVTMAVLGIGALAALKGYLWVQDGEIWKAALLGTVTALGLAVGGWGWWRWKKARKRVEDPLLIQEKVLPHRLRRRAPGHGRPAHRHGAASRQGASRPGGRRLPPLRQPRRGAVQGRQGTARRARPGDAAPGRPRPVPAGAASWASARSPPCGTRPERETRRPWWSGPARGRSAPRRRASGAARWWETPPRERSGRSASRRPAAPPPPLRRPHPHGQVHPDAPPRHAQAEGEGRGQGPGRHRGHRPPHRPGGRHPRTCPRIPHRQREAH